MSDANSRTVVLQDTHSLFGRGAATAVTFVQHQCDWLWAGDAKSVVLDVEVFDITGAVNPPTLNKRDRSLFSDPGPAVHARACALPDRDRWGRARGGCAGGGA